MRLGVQRYEGERIGVGSSPERYQRPRSFDPPEDQRMGMGMGVTFGRVIKQAVSQTHFVLEFNSNYLEIIQI